MAMDSLAAMETANKEVWSVFHAPLPMPKDFSLAADLWFYHRAQVRYERSGDDAYFYINGPKERFSEILSAADRFGLTLLCSVSTIHT